MISCFLIFTCIQPSFGENFVELNIFKPSYLALRKSSWPDWHLPYAFKRPSLNDDLVYPDWFEGAWDVSTQMEGDNSNESTIYSAKFLYNSSGKLIADRENNTKSYAMNIKDSQFLDVKNDPKSPNRQFARLTEDRYLETKIIGRLQKKINNDIFITDELILQILHSRELSRVSQVETLTEFRKCSPEENILMKQSDFNICAEQFQAIYSQPGQNLISLPVQTQKSKLILSKTRIN